MALCFRALCPRCCGDSAPPVPSARPSPAVPDSGLGSRESLVPVRGAVAGRPALGGWHKGEVSLPRGRGQGCIRRAVHRRRRGGTPPPGPPPPPPLPMFEADSQNFASAPRGFKRKIFWPPSAGTIGKPKEEPTPPPPPPLQTYPVPWAGGAISVWVAVFATGGHAHSHLSTWYRHGGRTCAYHCRCMPIFCGTAQRCTSPPFIPVPRFMMWPFIGGAALDNRKAYSLGGCRRAGSCGPQISASFRPSFSGAPACVLTLQRVAGCVHRIFVDRIQNCLCSS